MNNIEIISVREKPEYMLRAVEYISGSWPEVPGAVYRDCIEESLYTSSPMPQWYLLEREREIIGCCGMVTNDFNSRMDLWPWVCALYVSEPFRGNSYGKLLIEKCAEDARRLGFRDLYLTTDLVGYYEKYGFSYLGEAIDPGGARLNMYGINFKSADLSRSGKLTVREERPADFGRLHTFIETAFSTARVKDGTEQDYAAGLRQGGGYIPELALAVERQGEIIAHIMLTKTCVSLPGGGSFEGLLVAPLSVALEERNKGVGSMLLREAMLRAKAMGFTAVFLCGDPHYYHRFGFRSIARYGLVSRNVIPEQFLMVAELAPGALKGISGSVDFC